MLKKKKHSPDLSESVVGIDTDELDREWTNQPRLAHRYAALTADAIKEVEEAKANLELVRADLAQQYRSAEGKKTEKSIEEQIITDSTYQESLNELISAKHEKDQLQGVCNSVEHRKRALENLVSLFLADYFSSPRNRGSGEREKMDESSKGSVRRMIAEGLKRKRQRDDE